MANELSLDEFFDLLERYGADVASWPLSNDELQGVAALLVCSAAARDAVAEMRGIEEFMRAELTRSPAGLADRIFAASGAALDAAQPIRVQPRPRHGSLH